MGEREVGAIFLWHYATAVRLHRFSGVRPGGWMAGCQLWSVDLSREWVIVGNLEARRLQGDARLSPIVERATNYYASAGLAYRF